MPSKYKICMLGSGNWATAIIRIIGKNCIKSAVFDKKVTMFVYEEEFNGRNLTEIINDTHENAKYLPGYKLSKNVVAIPDLVLAAREADIIFFALPYRFLRTVCSTLLGMIKPTAIGFSLIKGFDRKERGGIDLISKIIRRHLRIPCHVLMGANTALEVAEGQFCEATIGSKDEHAGNLIRDLIQTENFRLKVVTDADCVELCGALKGIVACAAGFADALGQGQCTKGAIVRAGFLEMIKFVDVFHPQSKLSTFFESAGLAELISACNTGRHRRMSEMFVTSGKPVPALEQEIMKGNRLQGPHIARETYKALMQKEIADSFPLFVAVHKIFENIIEPIEILSSINSRPEHVLGTNPVQMCDELN